jgi:hypothetical protein
MDELWKQAFDNTEYGGKTSHRFAALLLAEPAPVQEQVLGFDVVLDDALPTNTMKFVQPAPVQPVAWMHEWDDGERVPMLRKRDVDSSDIDSPKSVRPLVYGDTTPPAQPAPVQEDRDWSLLEAIQESLREHMAEIKRLKAAQPSPVQEPDPCPGCNKGLVCRTPKCGRLNLPIGHPARTLIGTLHASPEKVQP